jgi:uncharacterized damage-inducible protein DinB
MVKKEFIEYYRNVSHPLRVLMELGLKQNMEWKPSDKFWCLGELIAHCAICPMPVVHTIDNQWPGKEAMAKHHDELKSDMQGVAKRAVDDFDERFKIAMEALDQVSEDDFMNKPSSTPWGNNGSMAKVLQGMVDHQNAHKVELYIFLKQMGLEVNTMTLYAGILPETDK